MKKIYSLIAMAAFALAANAEATNVAERTDAVYIEKTTVDASKEETQLAVYLKSASPVQTLGIDDITLPEGMKFVNHGEYDEDEEETVYDYIWLAKGNTTAKKHAVACNLLKDNKLRIGINTNKGDCFKQEATVLFYVYVNAGTLENGEYDVVFNKIEYSNAGATSEYMSNPVPGKLDVENVVSTLVVTNADAIETVAADGTQDAAPAKKVVDGQLVIETANGTFTAAGAQVK